MDTAKAIFYSLRPKHWVKNLFIFLPLVFGQKLFMDYLLVKTAAAFLLFSLAAGVVYLMNDIFDYSKDKYHSIKRLKPIASGKVTIRVAVMTAVIIGGVCVCLSFIFNSRLGGIVLLYILFNLIYSKYLKEKVIIDVFCIGFFFWLRLAAGSVVSEVYLSHWIVIMTVLLALFLGFNKRRQELRLLGKNAPAHRAVLAQYNRYFIDQMIAVITSSIVVTYLLYAVDVRTFHEVGSYGLIYSVPFVYYGIFRYLYLMHRHCNEGDPTRILLKDRLLQVNLVLWILSCIIVIYSG
ncbi:decaprenyl-phosphate phosphoribosyltransferase [Omnitrophica bacterium]|nr:decaprenyl-phosphate phosphoribosyltransferase [Candidatus Omnitrophota bacterium]